MKYLILALLLNGCATAQMLHRPNQTSGEFAPQNENQSYGTIKYLMQGHDRVIAARREDAYKQMFSACAGKYKIIGEGTKNQNVYQNVWMPGVTSSDEYNYITFACL
jgi:hypothetical protein